MKLLATTFVDDEPDQLTVSVSKRELALIYAFVCRVAPVDVTAASDIEWGNTFYDLTDDLSSIGNRFYDGGWSDIAPRLNPAVGVVR